MSSLRSASVLMPTYQGAEFLDRVLGALAAQNYGGSWDFWAVDSGSTDGTLSILERHRARFPVPFSIRHIKKSEFNHGDTRNYLASLCTGSILVYLTQDAIPSGPDWLANLLANFDDPSVGGAYCRNLPRPDASLLTVVFSKNDPGYQEGRRRVTLPPDAEYAAMDPHSRRLLYNFNDVASAIRADLWRRHPFPRTEFGEDLLMARALLEAGFAVVYDDRATVEHSHDYTPEQWRERARIDAHFNAKWLDRICVASASDAEVLVERQLVLDRAALLEAGIGGGELERELERARTLRKATFHGLHEGGLTEERRAKGAFLEDERLRVLFVVHGFPPETWAGTEVYTLNLARALSDLGHQTAVFARFSGKEPYSPADFEPVRTEYEGIPVWRMVRRGEQASMRATYEEPRAEAAFARVLQEERPDVVHFQHLLHLSARLPEIARAAGAATVITCNDYWGLCARVQLVRPDGVRCDQNQGPGCQACLRNRRLWSIPFLRKGKPLLDLALSGMRLASKLPALPFERLERAAQKRRKRLRQRIERYEDLAARDERVLAGYASCDLQIAPSEFLRSKYLASGRFAAERFVYSDYGVKTPRRLDPPRLPDPEGRLRLGFIGSLVWYKGLDVLLRAMKALRDRPVLLNVFGAFDPGRDAYHGELFELARESRVFFRGPFANDELASVLREVDVLVVPSVWFENSPITIHEAFLAETPVIASDIGGMAELVRPPQGGLVFRAGDDGDLAAAIKRLLDEPGLIAHLAENAPRVKSIQENAREMEFRYRALACQKKALAPSSKQPAQEAGTLRADLLVRAQSEEEAAEILSGLVELPEASQLGVHLAAPGNPRALLDRAGPFLQGSSTVRSSDIDPDRNDAFNLLASRSGSDVLVFLDTNSRPRGGKWLEQLCSHLSDPRVGAVLGGSRAGSVSVQRLRGARDARKLEALAVHGPLALRRKLWEVHPLPRAMGDGERRVAQALLRAGFDVVIDERAFIDCGPAPEELACGEELRSEVHAGGPMRVLMVVHSFPPETWAGTEVYTLNLAQALQDLGHSVTILARSAAQARPGEPAFGFDLREDQFQGLRVLRLLTPFPHWRLRREYDQPIAAQMLREVLSREKPDLVHFQHLIHTSAGLIAAARAFGMPTVVTCHDYWMICSRVQMIRPDGVRCDRNMGSGCFLCVRSQSLELVGELHALDRKDPDLLDALERGDLEALGRRKELAALPREGSFWEGFADLRARQPFMSAAFGCADLLISPSRFLRRMLIDTAGIDPSRLVFSDNGLRTELVKALSKKPDPEGRLRFGFVGSLVWYKGCHVLLAAMRELSGEPCVLHVHGDFRPQEDSYHAELARSAGENVVFRGRFDNARLSEVYSQIDVLVVPSIWYENSPITIHEAFLARTPVVASDIGGMAEFVRHGVDGLHFKTGDAASLAEVLRRFAKERDWIERLSKDWMEVKDIADNAREMQFRYRQLLMLCRPRGPRLLVDVSGPRTLERKGAYEVQGEGYLLLRKGARATYDLSACVGRKVELRLELALLAGENQTFGGTVFLDGQPLGKLPPFRAIRDGAVEECREFAFTADCRGGIGRLDIDSKCEGVWHELRIARVRVAEVGFFEADQVGPAAVAPRSAEAVASH